MNNLISYSNFLLEKSELKTEDFLKSQYNNIFKDTNKNLNSLFYTFFTKINSTNNITDFYKKYLKSNQTIIEKEINSSNIIEDINKLLLDQIKYFYFSLKMIESKLQNKDFTIEEIFKNSRDKRLQLLMSYSEETFSDAVSAYVDDVVIRELKEQTNFNDKEDDNNENEDNQVNEDFKKRIKYNIYKIFEQIDDEKILEYKKNTLNWINTSLFDSIKNNIQILDRFTSNIFSIIDSFSNQIKSTNNKNIKKMILNNIINMDKEQLKSLALSIGIKENELKNI